MNDLNLTASNAVSLKGFQIVSVAGHALEFEKSFNLVKGNGLLIYFNEALIHSDVRGLVALKDGYHLVREKDGAWWLCSPVGVHKSKTPLKKRNLMCGKMALMFDERGKLRLGQQSMFYSDLTY